MFISQGPLGSLQAEKICWLSFVTFIEWEISSMSFFPLFFPHFISFAFRKGPASQSVCVCVYIYMRLWACCVCVCAVFQPCGHASGTSTYYICHCLYHVTSIFCKQVSLLCLEGQTLLSLLCSCLSLSLHSCGHHFSSASLSFVSRHHTFHHLCLISLKL